MSKHPDKVDRLARIPALVEARKMHGSLTRVAELMSERGSEPITANAFYSWGEHVPPERCLTLYQIINGRVPLHEMNPVFPNLKDFPTAAPWPTQDECTRRSA